MSAAQIAVPQVVSRKLRVVRGRRRLFSFLVGTARAAALFGGLILAAMLLDWLFTPFSFTPRVIMTAAVLLTGGAAWIVFGLRPALARKSLTAVAEEVDSAVPQLQERWTTIADLSRAGDPPAMRGSAAMIDQVARESEKLHTLVEPQRIVTAQRLRASLRSVGAVLALFAIVWLLDRAQVNVLWQRFWSPTQAISLTTVTSPTAGRIVPRHESITILGALQNRLRDEATIWIRDVEGHVTQSAMIPDAADAASFSFPVDDVAQPLEYRIRAGDGQSAWYQIQVADRPKLTNVEFRITPPAYSRLPVESQAGLPRRTRALEGSTLDIAFSSSEPLRELNLQLADGSALPVERTGEFTFRYQLSLTEEFAFTVQLVNEYGLTNEEPPSCHIVVYQDQFPAVAIVSPESDFVVRPDDAITVEFHARDDFGISKAELVVTDATHPEDAPLKVIDIPLGEQQNQADVQGSLELDLKEFDLQQGANLSYAVRVFDTKDSTGQSRQSASSPSDSDQAQARAGQQASGQDQAAKQEPSDPAESKQNSEQQIAGQNEPQRNNQTAAQGKPNSSNSSPSNQSPKTAARSQDDDDRPQGRMEGAPRPADDMQRRELALGQCTSCKAMNLKIDEWAGSFSGQMREKLELAIEDYLARMEAALKEADDENQVVFDEVSRGAAWSDSHVIGARKAAGQLTTASEVAVELASTSAGTPYAFMGLQLVEIDERHVGPAQGLLQSVAQQSDEERPETLKLSLFHIGQAREMLARLSRTYAGVKINHQIAEAMTHVKKMHQVFIEDTFKLLGQGRPVLNPKQRKFLELELDEEFRNKLKALLEKKRDIEAELAKVLAQDPDLLRKFMSRARVDADSLRDQMTLLARRQEELREETRIGLESAAGAETAQALRRARHAGEAIEIAQQAAQMFENFETWLPKDLAPGNEQIALVHEMYAELAMTADQLAVAAVATPEDLTESADDAAVVPPETDPPAQDEEPLGPEAAVEGPVEAEAARPDYALRAYELLQQLQTNVPGLSALNPGDARLMVFITNRLAEVGKLNTRVSGWIKKTEAFEQQDRELLMLIDQTHLTNDTAELTNKIANTRAWMSGLTPEISQLADDLFATLEKELLIQQATAEAALEDHALPQGLEQQTLAVASFAKAEAQFDRLLEAIIAYLDSLPANTRPSLDGVEPKSLEELLAMLEDEKVAAEGLGIPCCRPSNLSIVRDWMSPSKSGSGGGGMGGMISAGVLAQAQAARRRADKLQQSAEERQRQLQAEAALAAAERNANGDRRVNPRWNTLQSTLDDSLNQVRGRSPPPKYRSAIELYFELISGISSEKRDE